MFFVASSTTIALADDNAEVVAAAKTDMGLIAKKDFEALWEQTSNFYKNWARIDEDTFVARWTLSRQAVGDLIGSKVIDVLVNPSNVQGYSGNIYTVTFMNTYPAGDAYEFLVLIKENGSFKLSNYGGAPKSQGQAPKSQGQR